MSRIFLWAVALFTIQSGACQKSPPADITDPGHLLYLGYVKKEVNCSRCHGDNGEGGWKGPDIRNIFMKRDSTRIVKIIKKGRKGEDEEMPAFGDKLTAKQLSDLLRFLKML